MIKRLSMVLMIVFMVVASLGCSQAVEEEVITEDAVTLEPEEAVDVLESGQVTEETEIEANLFPAFELKNLDEDFALGYLSQFQFVPTTLFVNSDGEIIGDPMVGAYDYETFEEAVKNHLGIE